MRLPIPRKHAPWLLLGGFAAGALVAWDGPSSESSQDPSRLAHERAVLQHERAVVDHERARLRHERALVERERALIERERSLATRERVLAERELELSVRSRREPTALPLEPQHQVAALEASEMASDGETRDRTAAGATPSADELQAARLQAGKLLEGANLQVLTQTLGAYIEPMDGFFGEDAEPPPPPPTSEGVALGEFKLTYYWISSEESFPGPRDLQLYTRKCQPLTKVNATFADRMSLEGTGRLIDGRTLNVTGECDCGGFSPCFFVTGRSSRWGVGVGKRPLRPFRSVAVDTYFISVGTKLYIPELDGLTMPGRRPYGGFVHDGCVVADDTGGRVEDDQLDLFFALKRHYEPFDRRHRIKRVRAFRDHPRCTGESEPPARAVHRNST